MASEWICKAVISIPPLDGKKNANEWLSSYIQKTEKMPKIADFAHIESLWSRNANFAGHPICGNMLSL